MKQTERETLPFRGSASLCMVGVQIFRRFQIFPKNYSLLRCSRNHLRRASVRTAQVKPVPRRGSIRRSRRAIFHRESLAARHALSREERERTAQRAAQAWERIRDKIIPARIGYRVVAARGITDSARVEIISLHRAAQTRRTAAAHAAALIGASTDAIAVARDSNVGIVVAVETLLGRTLRSIGKHRTVANRDSTTLASIAVDSIVAIRPTYRHAALKEEFARTIRVAAVDAIIVAIEIVLAAKDVYLRFAL